MDKEVAALWKEISAKAHLRSQAARRNPLAAAAGPARDQDNSGNMKLVAELEEPTLPAFTTLIDAHLPAKATAGNTAVINKVFTPGGGNKKAQNKQGGQGQQRPGISDAEKKRRAVMKGKSYRCGNGEHMANNCQIAKNIKCRTCRASGHIAAACLPTASIRAVEGESTSGNLAMEYQPD